MNSWSTIGISLLGVAVMTAGGCGYSEDQWQAKLREGQALTAQINGEKAARAKLDAELVALRGDVDTLRQQLQAAGGQVSQLHTAVSEQNAAIVQLGREKAQLDEIRARFDLLKSKLDSLTKLGLNVVIRHNEMTIQLPGDVLFDSGRTDLKKGGKEILLQVAAAIRSDPQLLTRSFQVAGHTDNDPLARSPYKDNWGLSLMRAREVVEFLVAPASTKAGGGDLPAGHWSAAGYGQTDPVAPNDTDAGKQKNRRVELIVIPNVEEMLDLRSLTK